MYHIKEDKRCIRSAKLIGDALQNLLETKPFMEITVSDIQRESGVGRSTFYRLFDNVDDVVTYLMDELVKMIVRDFGDEPMSEFTKACLNGVIEGDTKLLNIITDGRTDLLLRPFRNGLFELYRNADEQKLKEVYYSAAIFAGACTTIIRTWAENGRHESVDELEQLLEKYMDFDSFAALSSGNEILK